MRLAPTTVRLGTNGGAFGGRRRCVCRPSKENICEYKASVVFPENLASGFANTWQGVTGEADRRAPRIQGGVTMDVTHSGWAKWSPARTQSWDKRAVKRAIKVAGTETAR